MLNVDNIDLQYRFSMHDLYNFNIKGIHIWCKTYIFYICLFVWFVYFENWCDIFY